MPNTLSGIRVWNGVTENVNPEGSPIFVHKKLNEKYSDFYSFFSGILDKLSECTFLRYTCVDSFKFPREMIEEDMNLTGEDDPVPHKDSPLHFYLNDQFFYRDSDDGFEYDTLQFRGVYGYDYFQKASKYFRDDWDEIFLFDKEFSEYAKACEVFDSSDYKAKDEWVKENCTGLFYNCDGLTWTFYSKNDAYIELLKEQLSAIPSVTYKEIKEFTYREILGLNEDYEFPQRN